MSFPKETQLRIWIGDSWYCQISGAPIIFPPTMRLLDLLIPGRGYWDLRYKYRASPLLAVFAGNVDHIEAKKPPDNSLRNLQASANAWNISKSNRKIGEFRLRFSWWKGKPRCPKWDGLFGVFQRWYDPAAYDDTYLREWHEATVRVREDMRADGTWPYA